jgi:hypothetical protein
MKLGTPRRLPTLAVTLALMVLASTATAWAIPLKPGDILFTGGIGTVRVDPHTGVVTPFSSVGGNGIDYGAGQIYVTSSDTLTRIDKKSGEGTVVSSGGLFTELRSVAVARDGAVYVLNRPTPNPANPLTLGSVIKVNPHTGAQTLVASEIPHGTTDISVALDGSLRVATSFGVIYHVDPSTGAVIELTDTNHHARLDVSEGGALLHGGRSGFSFPMFPFFANVGGLDDGDEHILDVAWGPGNQIYILTPNGLFHTNPAGLEEFSVLGPDDILAHVPVSELVGFITVVTPLPGSLLLLLMAVAVGIPWIKGRRSE